MNRPASAQPTESPRLWVVLALGSTLLHGGFLLILGARSLQINSPSTPSGGNWVPITLWSATPSATSSSNNTPPAPPSPVPAAPQQAANTTQPTPQPSAIAPSPAPTQPQAKPTPTPQASPSPSPNPSPGNGNSGTGNSNGSGNGNNPNPSPTRFAVSLDGLEVDTFTNAQGEQDVRGVVDRVAQVVERPQLGAISLLLQNLSLSPTETIKIQTVIIVEIEGTATIAPNTTTVLQGNLTAPQSEKLAQDLIKLYQFEPTMMAGELIPYDYTITLTLSPNL